MLSLPSLIEDQSIMAPALPYTHSTTVSTLTRIINDKALKPIACDTFKGEDILYLFYGRADYRVNEIAKAHDFSWAKQITIVIKPEAIQDIYQIAPFDTGAFFRNRYHPYFEMFCDRDELNAYYKEQLCLGVDPDIPAKFIAIFYGSNLNYIKRCSAPDSASRITECLCARSILKMVDIDPSQNFDARGVSLEIQLKNTIPFNSEAIDLVLLPEDELAIFEETLNKLGINWQTYYNYHASPEVSAGFIYGKLRDHYSTTGLL